MKIRVALVGVLSADFHPIAHSLIASRVEYTILGTFLLANRTKVVVNPETSKGIKYHFEVQRSGPPAEPSKQEHPEHARAIRFKFEV